MKISNLRCDQCKEDIVLGEMAVSVTIEDKRFIIHRNRLFNIRTDDHKIIKIPCLEAFKRANL